MDERQARAIISQIRKLCCENGIWHDIKEENRPQLDFAFIELKIKVKK